MVTDGGEPRRREGGTYVYNMETVAPSPSSVRSMISKGWGSLTRSKTYKETRDREKMIISCNKREKEEENENEIVESRKARPIINYVQERKSVSVVETNVGSVAAFLQVKVLTTDMPGFMQVHAFRCARTTYDCMDNFSLKNMAYNIKKEFDKIYGPAWHCIVGSSFGSFVTHSTGCFIYFTMEKMYILVFKTKVQRAALI
ncbi:uncharacterized protein LOC127239889 [Andrographis paniculata]|uniref:uncharacterized protein LOC127239889 n=1 Tax=Andrographis paniculata TaxID=175694 RepID=UPI0021E7A045|nr:uncharacterized protein LOC127239889 [Andrographis paniculata]